MSSEKFEKQLSSDFESAADSIQVATRYDELMRATNKAAVPWWTRVTTALPVLGGRPLIGAGTALAAIALAAVFSMNPEQPAETITAADPEITETTEKAKDSTGTTFKATSTTKPEEKEETTTTEKKPETTEKTETTKKVVAESEEKTETTEKKEINENDFSEDFSKGANGFDIQVVHFGDVEVTTEEWERDSCGGDGGATITRGERASGFNNDWYFHCGATGQLFTSIGDTASYSIGAFSPQKTFTDVKEIWWDVNITDLGNRQWTEVAIVPVDQFDLNKTPCAIEWTPCENTHDELGSVGASFFGSYLQINLGEQGSNIEAESWWSWIGAFGDDPALSPITEQSPPQLRRHYFKEVDGKIKYGIQNENGGFEEISIEGEFPRGEVRVIFSDHNFTPLKAESGNPSTFTWHWDNIWIS